MPPASDGECELAEGCRLHWIFWDDEYVVFDEGSGDTHLLDVLSGEVLKVLEQSPGFEQVLTERVAARLGLVLDVHLQRRVREAIEKFRDAGLVEQIRP
jgi:PqqD family protein of HPr-rel-A system